LKYCLILGLAVAIAGPVFAQTSDSAFVAMEALGAHRFEDLADGGRIQLTRDPTDSAGIRNVRTHLAEIARAFAAGDFTTPGVVHAGKQVPGAATMTARREHIDYRFRALPAGGELRMITRDPDALKAIHQYLAFQRAEHQHQH
jgi:hypothetical protein